MRSAPKLRVLNRAWRTFNLALGIHIDSLRSRSSREAMTRLTAPFPYTGYSLMVFNFGLKEAGCAKGLGAIRAGTNPARQMHGIISRVSTENEQRKLKPWQIGLVGVVCLILGLYFLVSWAFYLCGSMEAFSANTCPSIYPDSLEAAAISLIIVSMIIFVFALPYSFIVARRKSTTHSTCLHFPARNSFRLQCDNQQGDQQDYHRKVIAGIKYGWP
jgi:hypothetical protein